MNKTLSQYFSLHRRYSRSINLERDLENPDLLEGYILTQRAKDALHRIWTSFITSDSNRAWTLTSVYGTGKSAFAHYLASLCAPVNCPMRSKALEIAASALGSESSQYLALKDNFPIQGYVRAIATGTREPISHTIIRAINRGIEGFWKPQKRNKIPVVAKLVDLETEIASGNKIDSREIPELVLDVAKAAKTGVFLILDELGKNLEFAAYNAGEEDLYLLQQLSELPRDSETPVYLLGILHQAFVDYGQRLATVQRNEWSKIQGRFENIPFTESAGEMMRLIGQAIDSDNAEVFHCAIHNQAQDWFEHLKGIIQREDLTAEIFERIYPLHPLTAFILPTLCQRYAQNDRSLFTFLTSAEPFSFKNFLEEDAMAEPLPPFQPSVEVAPSGMNLPTLKLDRVYDYFIEAAGMGLASRPNLQRWVEIQDLIADAKQLDPDSLRVLKTIGILNLATTTGSNKATRELVTLAMSDLPSDDDSKRQYWEQAITRLLQKGIITHKRQLDELRIWQGSDFNVDIELTSYIEKERSPLVHLLSDFRPLAPLVAQHHSYRTGTLRYFERRYLDNSQPLTELRCSSPEIDGLVGYWVADELPTQVPESTADGKPLIVLCASKLDILRIHALEFVALKKIQAIAPELQTDGVARKEVRYRVVEAEKLLDETLNRAFNLANNQNACWIQGKQEVISHVTDLNAKLSEVCDRVYHSCPILWNELINRRELTSQGAKARRELIEAMLERSDSERLGLEGYGPEVSMYYSLLDETGIHRSEDGYLGFYPPEKTSGLWTLWQAIEEFCLEAKEKPQTLNKLYERLAAPPYGVKQGAIPALLAAVLLYRVDDVGVYKDGTFIPVLGAEHFELLVKDLSRFAVKYFEVMGLRSQVFKELEAILRNPKAKKLGKLRNATLLTVVTPLYQFVNKLPTYTKKTKRLSEEALFVLQALQQTVEPDELLFKELPQACHLPPINTGEADDGTTAKTLRTKLVQILRELHTAYDRLLSDCQTLLYDAFGVRASETKLREDLRVRARYLLGKCVERSLRSFTQAAVDEDKTDEEWLGALVMIVADKPPESWTDEDVTGFEIKLSDLARKFKNLEVLQKEVAAKGEGFEARRITVTRSDGQETHRMVWVDREREEQIEQLVEQVLANLPDNDQIRQAVLAKLTERILNSGSQDGVTQLQEKRQSQKKSTKKSNSVNVTG
jgi:hypothetical protein